MFSLQMWRFIMKVLVCGGRHYNNYEKIFDVIKSLKEKYGNITIIEGGAPGADKHARTVCEKEGIPFNEYPADWKKYGRAAGPKRNQQMLDCECPDLVIAFHEDIESSKGTKDMINRARRLNIETLMIEKDPDLNK